MGSVGVLPICFCIWQVIRQVFGGPRAKRESIAPPPDRYMGLPILGYTVAFVKGRSTDIFQQMIKQSGLVFQVYLLFEWTVVVSGGTNLRKLLHGEGTLVEDEWPPGTKRLLGANSLSVQRGNVHALQRRLLQQAFTPDALARYESEIVTITNKFVDRWLSEVTISGFKEVKAFAFEVAAVALMHFEFDEAQAAKLRERFLEYTDGLFAPPLELPGIETAFSKALKAREYILSVVEKAVEERLGNTQRIPDVLQLMMDAKDPETGEKLTLPQLKDQSLLQLFAGHDTTASSMTSMLYYLAKHPEVCKKAQQEQDEVARTYCGDKSFSLQALNSMHYLDAVIREVLRLKPPVGGGFRRALKTFELEDGKGGIVQIPAGAKVQYSIGLTHSNAPVEDSDKFLPERWLQKVNGDESGGLGPSFVPFAAGRRKCLGFPLADVEMKIFGAVVLRRLDFALKNPDEAFISFPIPRPKDGLPMSVAARKASQDTIAGDASLGA
eukprot:gnl/TRDRNA2_/TRDRNA2_158915_c2_seq1.p1 gnl/TRDRNA2_/TRDRNA2_158915_c2~~gnl/TRDRNA2_/TRDRNA2_158915_c2_seq1.p1  ORF type:complete len:527 (-),score=96.76 gnl/TRDRNA2_/TRDRNA2_158915_c2_seq1:58-1545(-)